MSSNTHSDGSGSITRNVLSRLVPPGESATIEFTVPDDGLTFICSVEGHEAAGMRGEIHTTETDEND